MAKNLRDRGYSSSTGGENNSKKSATIKDKLKNAYAGVKDTVSSAVNSVASPYTKTETGTFNWDNGGSPIKYYSDSEGSIVDTRFNGGLSNPNGVATRLWRQTYSPRYEGENIAPNRYLASVDWNDPNSSGAYKENYHEVNTPIGSLEFDKSSDDGITGLMAAYTPSYTGEYSNGDENGSFYQMNGRDQFGTYSTPTSRGLYYDQTGSMDGKPTVDNKAVLGAYLDNDGAYGLGGSVNSAGKNYDNVYNLPLGLGTVYSGRDNAQRYAKYEPNQDSVLANLLRMYVGNGMGNPESL